MKIRLPHFLHLATIPTADTTSATASKTTDVVPAPPTFVASSATTSEKQDAVTHLRKRAVRYYLQRAKGPSAQRFLKKHQGEESTDTNPHRSRISELPRPSSVSSLRFCRICLTVSLVLLLASAAFIATYAMMPAFRVGIKSYEGIACSVAVATLLCSVVTFISAGYNLFRIYRGARRYADFITAMVDQNGNFVPEPDSDYAEYIKMFGTIIISQREYFDWFANGIPPRREIPASFLTIATV